MSRPREISDPNKNIKICRRGSRTQDLVISRCCFVADGKEMYQDVKQRKV